MIQPLYRTPEGFVDIPFVYVFDGRSLVNATSPSNLRIEIQDTDFYLRSVVGLNTVAQSWRYFNPSESEALSAIARTAARWPVVPEKFFPALSQLRFDLDIVTKLANTDGNEVSFIGFQGVKRVGAGQQGFVDYKTEYEYYEAPWSYQQEVTVNFFADTGGTFPRQFEITIADYDFELQKINIAETTTGSAGPLPVDPFLISLFDASNYNVLSAGGALSPRWVNFQQGGNFFSTFPVPTLVYPIQSIIRFDLTSLIDAAGGNRTFQFSFEGVSRRPCGGPNRDTRAT